MPLCPSYEPDDTIGEVLVATSSTRPTGTSLYAGRRIYETDTARELTYDGAGWIIMAEPVQSYTPVFANVTLGNGTVLGASHRSDGWCDFRATLTWGSTSSMGAAPHSVTLPYAAEAIPMNGLHVGIVDTGSNMFLGLHERVVAGGTTVHMETTGASLGPVNMINLTSSVPMNWAAGDLLEVSGRYQMDTRYL